MKRLEALEGLRGYAAFLVFLTHAFGLVVAKVYGLDADLFSLYYGASPGLAASMLLFRSHYGVDLFFVLSGLLMAEIALRRWPGTPRFLARRALRIYPAYLAALAAVLVASAFLFERTATAPQIAANAGLLQGFNIPGIAPINPVTWSLSFEAAFYLAVPLMALAGSGAASPRTAPSLALLAAFLAIVVASALVPGEKSILLACFALFVPGIYLGQMEPQARSALARRIPTALALGCWLAFEAAVKLELVSRFDAAYYIASGVAGGLLVVKACDSGGALARLLTLRPVLWLGRHSYSFFLIHYVVLHVLALALDTFVGTAHAAVYAIALLGGGLALSLAAARILYQATERFYFARPA
jgi:exopolysaccharide production protein ExoZ